jgi:hypothetical protein
MSERASVSSIEALESFRGALVRYIDKAKRALDDVNGEVRRTRTWLEADRRVFWEREVKRCEKKLAQADQELYSAQLSPLKETNSFQKMAVMKARRRLAEARERLVVVKKWRQSFDTTVEVRSRRLEALEFRVTRQLPKAVVFLSEAIKTLEAYAETRPGGGRRPAAEAEAAPGGGPPADAAEPTGEGGAA